MNILAVDDEPLALETLREAIGEALPGEEPACFRSGGEALAHARRTPVDVAFLDVRMEGMDGLSLARALLDIRPTTNIIFVTGFSDYTGAAMDLYASGYVTKPVRARRILKEIAHLRHPPGEDARPRRVKALGPYLLDHVTRRVYCDGRDALLKPREFELFHLFAANPGVVFTPEEIYEKIWGGAPQGSVHTVTVHVSGLRKKLDMDENGHPTIKKRRGEGYYLDVTP